MSHQVGLVWSGGNGWDDLMREQVRIYQPSNNVIFYFGNLCFGLFIF
jgi:hypothetical protein